jgi:hypothetical protein
MTHEAGARPLPCWLVAATKSHISAARRRGLVSRVVGEVCRCSGNNRMDLFLHFNDTAVAQQQGWGVVAQCGCRATRQWMQELQKSLGAVGDGTLTSLSTADFEDGLRRATFVDSSAQLEMAPPESPAAQVAPPANAGPSGPSRNKRMREDASALGWQRVSGSPCTRRNTAIETSQSEEHERFSNTNPSPGALPPRRVYPSSGGERRLKETWWPEEVRRWRVLADVTDTRTHAVPAGKLCPSLLLV